MKRALLIVVLSFSAVVPAAALAQEMTVVLKDGRELTGEVIQTPDGYRVMTRGGTIVVPAEQVAEVKERVTPLSEFRRRQDELSADDAQGHYELALWARERGLLEAARDQLRRVLRIEPNHENARLMLQLVNAQLETATRPAQQADQTAADPALAGVQLMGEADILQIRREELRSTDRVSIVFQDRLLDRFIERMRGVGDFRDPGFEGRFRRATPAEQAVYILETLGPEDWAMKNDIVVRNDPGFMMTFRSRIWPALQQSCATSNCHGSQFGPGGLRLFNLPAANNAAMYTNFYILESFVGRQGRLIDRDRPDMSLLLQYGLPGEVSQARHHPAIHPMFRSVNDRTYQMIRQWIDDLVMPRPEYRLEYAVPGRPAAIPTTSPVEQPF